jgi:hypothetical protein
MDMSLPAATLILSDAVSKEHQGIRAKDLLFFFIHLQREAITSKNVNFGDYSTVIK